MNKHSGVDSTGIFISGLTLLFIGLKLANVGVVSQWSWVWVLSPIWLPAAAIIVFLITFIAVSAATSAAAKKLVRKQKLKDD